MRPSDEASVLWNDAKTDIRPEFQLSFGHTLLRGALRHDWLSVLFCFLGVGKPTYCGALDQGQIPIHPRTGGPVLTAPGEIHLITARLADAWSIFGAHALFFSAA